jgi:hypothetical protein
MTGIEVYQPYDLNPGNHMGAALLRVRRHAVWPGVVWLVAVLEGLLPAMFVGCDTRTSTKKEPGASVRIRGGGRCICPLVRPVGHDGGVAVR